MKKYKVIKIMPCAMALSVILSGCGKKSDCEIPARHVHKYVKEVTEDIKIEKYLGSEKLSVGEYNWTDNIIEVTSDDLAFYKKLASKKLFAGADNWEYLYHQMITHPDYLEFYYRYNTVQTYTTTDGKGHVRVHTRVVTHSGWTTDPNRAHNTGKVRLNHYKYFGYQAVEKDGKITLEKSKEVDDVREILQDYPYVSEDSFIVVSEEHDFDKNELNSLSPYDFDTFDHPDLTNKDINLGVARTRTSN